MPQATACAGAALTRTIRAVIMATKPVTVRFRMPSLLLCAAGAQRRGRYGAAF